MKVEIYSDIACPWCYVGETRFFRALAAFPHGDNVEVVFRPFQLDPTLSKDPMPLKKQLTEKFGSRTDAMLQQTASTAMQEGLDFNWDDAVSVNTLEAHRLLDFAVKEYGAEIQRDVARKLFEAYFTEGENVGDVDVLTRIGVSAGIDEAWLSEYLASDEGRDDVLSQITRAQQIGVQAVPTFVFNGKSAVQGAQPTSAFMQVLEEIRQEDAAREEEVAANGEACVDGVCEV